VVVCSVPWQLEKPDREEAVTEEEPTT